ncbi:MAG: cysteine--tRNA ligase, partial [Candidatus Peregrinibacteria bacterium]|nr:cysteine--tRNA ligase [Candidatus Peregrinibacteria bacterium]
LWKKADESHLMQWDFNTGKVINPGSGNSDSSLKPGFPGWHIECSAMSRKLLGESFDIHTGGEDNIFPHHECEIAQNTCSIDGKVVGAGGVNYWLHGKHLLVDGKKMSKSKGNFYTIRDLLEKGYTGAEIRYLFLSAHYRTALNFTFDSLEMARGSIARIVEAKRLLSEFLEGKDLVNSEQESSVRKEFKKELFDDLNVSGALAVVFEGINVLMKWREDGTLKAEIAQDFLDFLENDFNQVFNIFPEEQSLANEDVAEIEAKIEERKVARENKDWAKSDEIRDYLLEKFGIELIDEAGGTSFRVK